MTLDFNNAPPQNPPPSAPPPLWVTNDAYDRDDVHRSLIGQIESVLGHLYPNGFADPKGTTFYVGSIYGEAGESLNVVLTGPKAGLWHDFATAEGGDIFDLWQAARGLPSFRETLKDAALYSGATATVARKMPKRKQPAGGEAWGAPVITYRYLDANGNIIAEVDRFEWEQEGEKKKAFRPWNVATRRHQAPETRPLYNLPNITNAPEIFIVEGEKAADALIAQNINATTAMGGAAAPLDKTDWSIVRGRVVKIWPDNDQPGKDYAERLKTHLEAEGAASVTILQIPSTRPHKWDAADAGDDGEDLGALIRAMQAPASQSAVSFTIEFWDEVDLAAIPRVQFVYNRFYAKGYTSVTAAPPKVGKSLLGLIEAVDIATGRGLLTGEAQAPQRVYYYNAEDDIHTIHNRVGAILQHYGIPQSEVRGQIALQSGVGDGSFYIISGQDGQLNHAQLQAMEESCLATRIDCMILDPLQDLSRSPETNEVMRILGGRLRAMASRCQMAIGLIHHTRKIQAGVKATIDDMRGGSALRGVARFNRLLSPMTEDDAVKAGVKDHRDYFQIGDIEGNLAPPSSDYARWFEKVSVIAANGESVGVIAPWQWPDAFQSVTKHDAAKVRYEIDKMAEPPRSDVRSKAWVGEVIASVLGLNLANLSDKARVKALISGWVKTDVLRISEGRDSRAGRAVQIVICGANDPLSEGGEA